MNECQLSSVLEVLQTSDQSMQALDSNLRYVRLFAKNSTDNQQLQTDTKGLNTSKC
jgi:hypothetical protein